MKITGGNHDMGAKAVTLTRSVRDAPRTARLLSECGYRKVVIER